MSDVTIKYKGQSIATMDATGSKTLETSGTYCEDDIGVEYVKPAGGGGDMYKLIDGTITDADIDWSLVTEPKVNVFDSCRALTRVNNPIIRNSNAGTFRNCTGLTYAELSYSQYNPQYGNDVFRGCSLLTLITIHFLFAGTNTYINFAGAYYFGQDEALETVVLHVQNAKELRLGANSMFYQSAALRNLVLKASVPVVLNSVFNANNFGGIYSNPTESTIYVPQALISQYQQATNWSTMYAAGVTFAAIEGSIYDD